MGMRKRDAQAALWRANAHEPLRHGATLGRQTEALGMTVRSVAGVSSIVAGALGLLTVIGARHGESFRGTGSGYLLTLADRLGFIHNPPADGFPEARAPGLLSFTDETALQTLLNVGVSLGVVAMLLAICAAARREDNLYLSAGFICGGLGIVTANFVAGVVVLVVGAVVVLTVRRRRTG